MRFVNLIVTLEAILARAVPLQQRDIDFGGDFGFGTESIGEDLSYTPTDNAVNLADLFGSEPGDITGFTTSNIDIAFGGESELGAGGFSAETLDLANLIPVSSTFTPLETVADVFAPEPEGPAVVADVPTTGLGLTDGDLIASANTPSNSLQVVGTIALPKDIEPFTPGPGTQDILDAAENPAFSTSDSPIVVDSNLGSSPSSPDNVQFTSVGTVALPEGIESFTPGPGTQDILNAAENPTFSTSDSSIVVDSSLGSSTSSPDNLQFTNVGFVTPAEGTVQYTPGPGTEDFIKPADDPFSGMLDTVVSAIDGTPFDVGVNPATLSEGELNLSTFKAATGRLATDVKLPPDMQEYFDRITKAPLTENDWKIISGTTPTGGNSQSPGSTTNSQVLSLPAREALQGFTLSPQNQRQLQSNSGFDLAGIGSNFAKALIAVAQTAIQKAVIQNNDERVAVVTQRVPVAVPVTQFRPVAVPVTLTLVRGVRVPVTVISTLPGGVVTKIVVLPSPIATPSTLLNTTPSRVESVPVSATTSSQSSIIPIPLVDKVPVASHAAGVPQS